MDAAINLPPKGSSDFVRKMTEELAVNCSFEPATTFMARHFPLATATRALHEADQTDSLDAKSHYGCAPAPPSSEQETILAVEADGKGMRVILEVPPTPPEPGKPKGPPKREGKKGETIDASAAYFHNNLATMKYDEYLAKGWAIATGVIEGACRNVVKDRCERSGMRWTEKGAEAILHLRCIHLNGDWQAHHEHRMKLRHEVVYNFRRDPHTILHQVLGCEVSKQPRIALAG
jgi:hypothetical protein